MPGACPRDLKAPLSGAGGVNNLSRPSLALCASASPVFRSRVAKERRIARFSFLFFGGGGIRRPRPQGAPFRGRGCRQRIAAVTRAMRECESRFPLQKREESQDSSLFLSVRRPVAGWLKGGRCCGVGPLCRVRIPCSDAGQAFAGRGLSFFCTPNVLKQRRVYLRVVFSGGEKGRKSILNDYLSWIIRHAAVPVRDEKGALTAASWRGPR